MDQVSSILKIDKEMITHGLVEVQNFLQTCVKNDHFTGKYINLVLFWEDVFQENLKNVLVLFL